MLKYQKGISRGTSVTGWGAIAGALRDNLMLTIPPWTDWTAAVTGGAGSSLLAARIKLNTSVTATSTAKASWTPQGLMRNTTNIAAIDWTKKLLMTFDITRQGSDAEVTAYVQLRLNATLGDLAAKGIGVAITNLTLKGETYGASRSVSGNYTITEANVVHVAIILDSPGGLMTWVVDAGAGRTVIYEQDTTKIPTTTSNDPVILVGIANGGTGGVNATIELANLQVFQRQGE